MNEFLSDIKEILPCQKQWDETDAQISYIVESKKMAHTDLVPFLKDIYNQLTIIEKAQTNIESILQDMEDFILSVRGWQ